MDTYHDNYVDMGRGQEMENGYSHGGVRPRAQYGELSVHKYMR